MNPSPHATPELSPPLLDNLDHPLAGGTVSRGLGQKQNQVADGDRMAFFNEPGAQYPSLRVFDLGIQAAHRNHRSVT